LWDNAKIIAAFFCLKAQIVKVYRGRWNNAPLILYLDTSWLWVVCLCPRGGREPSYPLIRRSDGLQSCSNFKQSIN
jgi:hypothetical protein